MASSRREFLRTSALASSLLLVPKFLHALDRGPGLARLGEAPGACSWCSSAGATTG